jgi:hypothetical protein
MRNNPFFAPTRPSGDASNAPATTEFVGAAIAAAVSSNAGIGIFSSVADGLVPASGGGTTTFLRADATFAAPATQSQTVVQVVQVTNATTATLGTQIPLDDTAPSTAEGNEIFSQSITPASSISKFLVETLVWGGSTAANQNMIVAIFRGSNCIQAQAMRMESASFTYSMFLDYLDSPASTSAITYSVRGGNNGASDLFLNGNGATRLFGGAASCTLTLTEVSTA